MTALRDVDTAVYRLAPAARCEQCEWLPLLEDAYLAARRHTAATDHETAVERVVARFYSTVRQCTPMGTNARGVAQCAEGHGDYPDACDEAPGEVER